MRFACAAAMVMVFATMTAAQAQNFEQVVADHPAKDVLTRIFATEAKAPEDFKPSGMTKKDYLPLIAGNVDFWKHFQNEAGAIIDPYEGKERQYSTPAFALAGALLVAEANRQDLLDHSSRAMTFATHALANKTTADNHADFYIPMLMHARRILKDKVKPEQLAAWDRDLRSVIPEKAYRDVKAGGNWNIVHVTGEYLRRKDGLVADDQKEAQLKYLENCLDIQQNTNKRFTKYGMYADPNWPLAYDAFPRLWLEDAVADGAIEGEWGKTFDAWLSKGALSGLLLLSPTGEWPHGGRSAHHQWNEAENAEINEINANRWHKAGRDDIAGAFKRAARLCLTSMYRWQRPSGEMWIVKNFADPARRHGYEGYSFHSQYNLLAMGMLAIAYIRADDSIQERPIPSEHAAYVFNLHEEFHHVAAAAGGYYVLLDTAADPHYGSTGVQRVHRVGVELSPFTDTPGPESGYGPSDMKQRAALAAGVQWKDGEAWRSLADYGVPHQVVRQRKTESQAERPLPKAERTVEKLDVAVKEQTPERVNFSVTYTLAGGGPQRVVEQYSVSRDGVEGSQAVAGQTPQASRAVFPALVDDGARPTEITIEKNKVTIARKGALTRDLADEKRPWITRPGGSMTFELLSPGTAAFALDGPAVPTHNGYVRAMAADLGQAAAAEIRWKITLEPAKNAK